MRYKILNRFLKGLFLALVAIGLTAGASFGVDLATKAFNMTMPDGSSVPMWGFVLDTNSGAARCYQQSTDAARVACVNDLPDPTVPGPRIGVGTGNINFQIRLTNTLPEPVSIVIPGQKMPNSNLGGCVAGPVRHEAGEFAGRVRSFGCEAPPNGGKMRYRWRANLNNQLEPGSYMYQSGTHPQVQIQMGLYGAIRRDAAAGQAYTDVPYDMQQDLFFSEVDPALHAAVDSGIYGMPGVGPTSTLEYFPKYFLLQTYDDQGKVVDATIGLDSEACIDTGAEVGDRLLLRLYNAGLRELAPMMIGSHFDLVAESGKKYPFARTQYQTLLLPGSTKDAVFTPSYPGTFPLIERRLNLTDGAATDGGMQTCFAIGGTVAQAIVPNVVNGDQAAAEIAIEAEGLTVGTVTPGSNAAALGLIVSQDPAAGTGVPPLTPVNLVISSPTVPYVIGQTLAAAETAITDDSLTVGVVTSENSNAVIAGTVINQNPLSGVYLPGTPVNLTVSTGDILTCEVARYRVNTNGVGRLIIRVSSSAPDGSRTIEGSVDGGTSFSIPVNANNTSNYRTVLRPYSPSPVGLSFTATSDLGGTCMKVITN